jgi:hypothetical protein
MPHSSAKKKQRERTKKVLQKRIDKLKKLKEKHLADAQTITLDHVDLGSLRRKYKHKHYKMSNALKRICATCKAIASEPDKPLLIYGSDGGLLAARVPLNRPELIASLSQEIDQLPSKTKHYAFKGVKRSEYETRHYGCWAAYSQVPYQTAEHRSDGPIADSFLASQKETFRAISAVLGGLAPGVFKDFQMYPISDDLHRAAGAWAACVINQGGEHPNQTEIHRDVKESQYGYSCIVACGDYHGGDIFLYELHLRLELRPGDILLFPDALIHHNNAPAVGTRKSVVAFTQENMNDYWARKYGMKLKKHLAKGLTEPPARKKRKKRKKPGDKPRKHKKIT